MHLLVLWSSALVRLDLFGSEDLDGAWSSSVSSGHLSVHLGDSEWEGNVSVLSVHVFRGGSRVVSDPDTIETSRSIKFVEKFKELKQSVSLLTRCTF